MSRNIIETIMGAVVLLVAIVFVTFAFRTSNVGGGEGYQIKAQFDDAAGLSSGTDVRMAGVKVGSVVSQSLDPKSYLANIVMSIDDTIELPTDTSARIIPDGLLGGNYVSLEPGGEEDMLKPGGSIQYTQGSINVVDLLGRFIFSAADSAGKGASKSGSGSGSSGSGSDLSGSGSGGGTQ
jgi:phospholipid/cholesterol/gamma-HCH transport system substrate-binding protein